MHRLFKLIFEKLVKMGIKMPIEMMVRACVQDVGKGKHGHKDQIAVPDDADPEEARNETYQHVTIGVQDTIDHDENLVVEVDWYKARRAM